VLLFGSAVGLFFGFNAIVMPFFLPGMSRFGKIPFLASTPLQVKTIFEMIPKDVFTKSANPVFVDLGSGTVNVQTKLIISGDGRLVIEAAKRG
jgi:hypothetical protein